MTSNAWETMSFAAPRRDMWYGVPYTCVGISYDDRKQEEDVALAAIMNFIGMVEPYCSSPANDNYTRGHRYATRYAGENCLIKKYFLFQVYDPIKGMEHIADVLVFFEWINEVGEDKVSRTVGKKVWAEIHAPGYGS